MEWDGGEEFWVGGAMWPDMKRKYLSTWRNRRAPRCICCGEDFIPWGVVMIHCTFLILYSGR